MIIFLSQVNCFADFLSAFQLNFFGILVGFPLLNCGRSEPILEQLSAFTAAIHGVQSSSHGWLLLPYSLPADTLIHNYRTALPHASRVTVAFLFVSLPYFIRWSV